MSADAVLVMDGMLQFHDIDFYRAQDGRLREVSHLIPHNSDHKWHAKEDKMVTDGTGYCGCVRPLICAVFLVAENHMIDHF